jgi:hypothetical protein
MHRVPSPHLHGTVLQACGKTAVVLDGYAVHEDEATLRLLADAFGLVGVESAPDTTEPVVVPFYVQEPATDAAEHTWADDGGAVHTEDTL